MKLLQLFLLGLVPLGALAQTQTVTINPVTRQLIQSDVNFSPGSFDTTILTCTGGGNALDGVATVKMPTGTIKSFLVSGTWTASGTTPAIAFTHTQSFVLIRGYPVDGGIPLTGGDGTLLPSRVMPLDSGTANPTWWQKIAGY